MSAVQVRRQLKKTIDALPADRLPVAADFLNYLRQRKDNAATRELLSMSGVLSSIQRGLADATAGRITNWREVRSDV